MSVDLPATRTFGSQFVILSTMGRIDTFVYVVSPEVASLILDFARSVLAWRGVVSSSVDGIRRRLDVS